MPGSILFAGLVYGLDSFLVSIPLGAMELSRSRRRWLALAFGACDGLATGLGASLALAGVRFLSGELEWIAPTLIAGYGLYVMSLGLLATADVSHGKASRLAYALPVLLSLDNFIGGSASWISAPEGVAGAIAMGAISGAMSLAGLTVGGMLVRSVAPHALQASQSAIPRLPGLERSEVADGEIVRTYRASDGRHCACDARRVVQPRPPGEFSDNIHSSSRRRTCSARLAGGLFLLAAAAMYCVEWLC